jgi:hypothetical protein
MPGILANFLSSLTVYVIFYKLALSVFRGQTLKIRGILMTPKLGHCRVGYFPENDFFAEGSVFDTFSSFILLF